MDSGTQLNICASHEQLIPYTQSAPEEGGDLQISSVNDNGLMSRVLGNLRVFKSLKEQQTDSFSFKEGNLGGLDDLQRQVSRTYSMHSTA